MPEFLTPEDLTPFAAIAEDKAQAMIDDATARAVMIAPCIASDEFANVPAVRAILRTAILRWNDAGSGAVSSLTAGPYGQTIDTRPDRKGVFWPSEITDLQGLCAQDPAYSLSLAGDIPPQDGYWDAPDHWTAIR